MSSSPTSPVSPEDETISAKPDDLDESTGRRRVNNARVGRSANGPRRRERLAGAGKTANSEIETDWDGNEAYSALAQAEVPAAERLTSETVSLTADRVSKEQVRRRPLGSRVARRVTAATKFSVETLAQASYDAGPVASNARIQPRHRLLFRSFVALVLLPLLVSGAYLWGVAEDQYASTVGFSVRREDSSGAVDLLGGLASLTKSSSSDTDILYEYLRSQKLVADMDARVNLRSLWSKPTGDPVFVFDADGSIEDLLDYWQRMVRTSYDSTTGLIEVRVLAFDPDDATLVAEALLDESAAMINALSAAAREDAVRFSREDLTIAEDRLRGAREAVTAFRVKNQIVDPTTDFQTQAGLVGTLENQLAAAQIELDLLSDAPDTDPRVVQAKRRAEVILARIASERSKVGEDITGKRDLAALAADYERLVVDREFAESAYVAALSSYDAKKAESTRITRYLAAHVLPTTAEVSRYPERFSLLGLLALFLGLIWSIGTLVAYSVRDRR